MVTGGRGHEPYAHFGDDAEVGLGEDTIGVRAETIGEELPSVVAGESAHTGSHYLSVRQYNLHS